MRKQNPVTLRKGIPTGKSERWFTMSLLRAKVGLDYTCRSHPYGFRVFANDVNQAYLQIDEELTRQLFLLPKKGP